MAKIAGSKTTKAAEAESLKAARTKHRVGVGQLFIQPTAHADRASAQSGEELEAVAFVKAEPEMLGTRIAGTPISAPAPVQTDIFEHRGWKVRTGGFFISEAQAKWIIDIAERPSVTPEMRESLAVRLEQGFAKSAGSAFITKYKDTPKAISAAAAESIAPGASTEEIEKARDVRDAQGVAEGRYAVEHEGVLKFFRITKGKGRWEGRTFIEVQASDDRWPVRNPAKRQEILELIAENPVEAAVRYGVELGSCHRCGRTLTDATSRELGIGPDCRNK